MASNYEYFDFQQEQFVWPVWSEGYIWSDEVRDKRQDATEANHEERLRTLRADPTVHPDIFVGQFSATIDEAREKKNRQDAVLTPKQKKALSIPRTDYDFERPPFLIPRIGEGEWRLTFPLEYKQPIFKQMADLDPGSREDIEAFAKRHGNLTKGVLLIPYDKVLQRFPYGVSISTWQREIEAVKWADRVWEMVDKPVIDKISEAQKELRQLVKWNRDRGEVVIYMPVGIRTLKVERYPELATASSREVRLPIMLALRDFINDKLLEHRVMPRLLYDQEGQRLVPRLSPEFLIGAVWLQLYQVVVGEIRYRRCSICGKWEDVTKRNANWNMHEKCAHKVRQRKYHDKKTKED